VATLQATLTASPGEASKQDQQTPTPTQSIPVSSPTIYQQSRTRSTHTSSSPASTPATIGYNSSNPGKCTNLILSSSNFKFEIAVYNAIASNIASAISIPNQTKWFVTTKRDSAKTLVDAKTVKHKTSTKINNTITCSSNSNILTLWIQHNNTLLSKIGKMHPSNSRTSSLCSTSARTTEDMDVDNPAGTKCTTPETAQLSHNTSKQDQCSSRSVKKSKQALSISLFKDSKEVELWLGFPAMEQLVINEGKDPITIDTPLEDLILMGFIQGEAQESLSTKMSFLRVAQKLWPIKRPDNIEGQHVNITQLPFNIDINQDMELSSHPNSF
jgi:hypothetical protein